MIRKALMALTVIVLVILIIITPSLIGKEPGVSSIPKVIVDYADNETIVHVTSALGDHRFTNISIYAENASVGWSNESAQSEAYSLTMRFPGSVVSGFFLNVTVYDDENGYEYNCSVVLDLAEKRIGVYEKDYKKMIYDGGLPFMDVMREMKE